MILGLLDEAVRAGARLFRACEVIGLSLRTVQRWRREKDGGEDRRAGPRRAPANKLSPSQRREVLEVVNSPELCDLSPHQIVPELADQGIYLASERTIYRLLAEESQLSHRQRSRAPVHERPRGYVAHGPNEVWSWDITYLLSPVRGQFFYLYLILDVWSRKIVGAQVYGRECMSLAAELFERSCAREGVDPSRLVLHADNGGPMKGSTMLATLHRLEVEASFSRPRVSDDNPYSEALFRTLKYRPEYPPECFETLEHAQEWVDRFEYWYNHVHRHSALRFVTPEQRHSGRESEILASRQAVYEQARERHPERWSGPLRNWEPVGAVCLNVPSEQRKQLQAGTPTT
jgi:transposase InsO family protein